MNLKKPKANLESGTSLLLIQVLQVLKYKILQDNEYILVSAELFILLMRFFYIKK